MKYMLSVLLIAALFAGFFLIVSRSAGMAAAPERIEPQVSSFLSVASKSPQIRLPQSASGSLSGHIPGDPFLIQPTLRISIPYGINTPLPVLNAGQDVIVSGHGGCTQDQQVTIALTVTQSTSGALATGQGEQTCTGVFQTWSTLVTSVTTDTFVADPAQACGLATTYDGIYPTDTYDWCRDVDLIRLDHRDYLPMIVKP